MNLIHALIAGMDAVHGDLPPRTDTLDVDELELADDCDPTLWCNGCGARTSRDCACPPIADNE